MRKKEFTHLHKLYVLYRLKYVLGLKFILFLL